MLLLSSIAWAPHAWADTGLKIFTQKGYVGFVVADDWAVVSMNTKGPIAAAVFQLPNSAESGTAESTNLALLLYDLQTTQGRSKFDQKLAPKGSGSSAPQAFEQWTVYRQHGTQHGFDYTILDATRKDVADRGVAVSFAWPHLPDNPPDYDQRMEQTFQQFLQSVVGHLGPYKPEEGEVVRRRTN